MPSAFTGTLRQLKELNERGTLAEEIALRHTEVFHKPSDSMINSWRHSIPPVLDALSDNRFDGIQVLVEYRMPIGEEKTDLILLGGSPANKKGLIIELKQHADFTVDQATGEILNMGFGRKRHPAIQVLGYHGWLKNLHSAGEHYEFTPVLFMHNLSQQRSADFFSGRAKNLRESVITFYRENTDALADLCDELLLPTSLANDEVLTFSEAPYKQATALFDLVRNKFTDIWNGATESLAETGFCLTENQHDMISQILNAVKNKEEKVFLISGKPGSGKSLVALYLLISSLSIKKSSVFVARGNRFVPLVRNCFDGRSQLGNIGANGLILYVDSARGGNFIGNNAYNGYFDLVICDEGQRFRKTNIDNILKRSPVTVFFYDEQQRLNPPEEGTRAAYLECALKAGKEVTELELESAIRCKGGEDYHAWVEQLISLNGKINPDEELKKRWSGRYSFEVFNDVIDMRDRLRNLNRDQENKVALVASFTESDGRTGNLLRVGYPLQSGFDLYRNQDIHVDWLMQEDQYRKFWLERESNKLTHCASIYGSQGFESDYVGVIWGRDFVIRNGVWTKGEHKVNYDSIDGLVRAANSDPALYLQLLQNRYRIFLTRGMLGTFVFCEDEETREYLLNIIS